MDIHSFYALTGFLLAAYSVIGNDSVQTLGTFIASNNRFFRWYYLWGAATAVMAAVLSYAWFFHGGDISFGRLERIPPVRVEWYHAAAPAILILLTVIGIPVSTTFLVLSAFASTVVLESMLVKSALGYVLSAAVAYIFWMVLAHFLNEKKNKVKRGHRPYWRTLQWLSTGLLWSAWLAQDMANIAVFLPRQLEPLHFIGVLAVLSFWLAVIFRTHGGKIQNVILEKTGSRFIRSATIIDFVYAAMLWYFMKMNNIPMSTTWVFVGLLCGRELAIATVHRADYKFKYVFPIIGRDFLKMMIGLGVSVTMVLVIHYLIAPASGH
ncbi:MAG: hypothetical protein WC989_03385 [Micavibrio sp.]